MKPTARTSAELKRAKRELRRATLVARDSIDPSVRTAQASSATERFLALEEVGRARTVMAFWSFGSEPPTAPLIDALNAGGIVIALPHVAGGAMEPRRYGPGDPMTETTFGALEPSLADPVNPLDIDVVVTPAVAFDRLGGRVGYGGGFYDRFFPRTRPDCLRVGFAMQVQVLPPGTVVPGGHFDLRVHVIVTGSETIRCPRP